MKDDHQPERRQTKRQRQAAENQWAAAGFNLTDWNKWAYTWPGNFPVFEISPGILTNDTGTYAGLIARYASAGIEILFVYGTPPQDIAARLDTEIGEIDVDDYMTDNLPLTNPPVNARTGAEYGLG